MLEEENNYFTGIIIIILHEGIFDYGSRNNVTYNPEDKKMSEEKSKLHQDESKKTWLTRIRYLSGNRT